MKNFSERRPDFDQMARSSARGALVGGSCIFGFTLLTALTLSFLPGQRDYGLGILFDDLGGRMLTGAIIGGVFGVVASCYYSKLSKPVRMLSLSILLAYALYLVCSPLHQQALAKQMMVAIDRKDLKAVKHILTEGYDINRVYWTLQKDPEYGDPNGDCECSEYDDVSETALIHAIKSGDRAIVALLLQQGADVNERNEGGRSVEYEGVETDTYALSTAAAGEDSDMVALLLDHGAHVNAAADSGEFALSIAAFKGHASIVQLLIEHGADVQAKTREGNTPLYYAATSGNTACARLVLDHGADVNVVDKYGETALFRAASCHADTAFISLLLDHGASLLLDHAPDPAITDQTRENALTAAAKANNLAVARLLHMKGLPLHVFEAASLNDAKTLDRLLHNGEKLEQKDNLEMTPLLNAVQANNVQAVRLLLSRGANIHAVCNSRGTALMLINDDKDSDPTEMIDFLAVHGSDINAVKGGNSVLMQYVIGGDVRAVRALLKYHPDLTLRDCYHETALIKAREFGNKEIVDLLVKAGAQE